MAEIFFCADTVRLQHLWDANQKRDAVKSAAQFLRSDSELSLPYRELVAFMLESIFDDKTSRSKKVKSGNRPGPKKAIVRKYFYEIGADYDELISEGLKLAKL